MSGYDAGEAYVKIRPLVDPDFASKIKTQVTAGLKDAEQMATLTVEQASKKIADLQTMAQAATFRQDDLGASRLEAVAQLQQVIFAAQQARAQAVEMVSADQAAMRELLLASADAYDQAAIKLREMIALSQQTGKPVLPPGTEASGPGGLARLEQLARGTGRSEGLGGILSGLGRGGILGAAAIVGFQAIGELQKSLRATGDEAFTTEGKIRNLGAEVLGGNLIGGVKALLAQKPAEFDKPLQQAIADLQQVKTLQKDTTITAEELVRLQSTPDNPADERRNTGLERYTVTVDGATKALKTMLASQVESGAISKSQAKDFETIAQQLVENEKFALAAAAATDAYAAALERAGGVAEKVFGPDSRGGPGGIAAAQAQAAAGNRDIEIMFNPNVPEGTVIGQQRTGRQAPILQPNTSVFRAEDPDGKIAQQVRDSIIQRTKDDVERTKLDLAEKIEVQRGARANFETKKAAAEASNNVNGAAQAYLDLVQATTGVVTATQAAKIAAAAAATAAQDLGNQVRDSALQTIADPVAKSAAELRNAKIKENQALEAFKGTAKGTKEADQAWADYRIAVNNRKGIEVQIAADQKAATDAANKSAADLATQRAADAAAAKAQAFENQIAKAALTKRKTDDEAAFAEAIAYWKSVEKNAANAGDREAAEAKIIDLRKRRAAFRKGEDTTGATHTPEELEVLQIQNRIDAAKLTPSLADDKKFAHQLVEFWKGQVKILDGYDKAQAQSRLIAARLFEKGLKADTTESADVFVNRLFTEAADQFRRFGSNFSTSGGMLAPQDARGALGGILLGGRANAEAVAQSTRQSQLDESKKQTAYLQVIANGPTRKVVAVHPPEGAEKILTEIGANVLRGL